MFRVAPNILIGVVGDYNKITIDIVRDIERELELPDFFGDYNWSHSHDKVSSIVSSVIKRFSPVSQDVVLVMHDMRDQKRYAYKLLQILDFDPYMIENYGFIGLDPELHNSIIDNYRGCLIRNNPHTIEDYANAFLESLKNVKDITVNEFPICYVLGEEGIKIISNGTGYIGDDGGVNWVVNTINENGQWIRKVNGKTIGNIISDANLINERLNREYNGRI